MRGCGAVFLSGAAFLLAGATKPITLDELVGFNPQGICQTTAAFEALIRSSYKVMNADGGVAARQPALAPRYRAAFGKVQEKRNAEWTSIILPLRNARWGDLPITELALHFPVGGDPALISLQFRATIAQVRRAIARKHIKTGSADDGVYTVEMTLTRLSEDPSQVLLECGWG